MAHCGRNIKQLTVLGVGYGATRQAAVTVATTLAETLALGAGDAWIDQQECPDNCPFRDESVRLTGRARVEFAGQIVEHYWIAVVKRRAVAVLECKEKPEKERDRKGNKE